MNHFRRLLLILAPSCLSACPSSGGGSSQDGGLDGSLFDSHAPQGQLRINGGAAVTSVPGVVIQLSVTDDVGVTGYFLSESAARPALEDAAWVMVSPAADFHLDVNFTLTASVGDKTVVGWFRDAAGHISEAAQDSVTLDDGDSLAPAIRILSPTSQDSYSTSGATIPLAGTASDNVGVASVSWSNDRGGEGGATGTVDWSISQISLQSGVNLITVTATDAYANSSRATIRVTTSINSPSVAILPASGISQSAAILNASINPNGLPTMASFQYGMSPSALTNETPRRSLTGTQPLSQAANVSNLLSGRVYYYRAVASNSAGSAQSNVASFTTVSSQPGSFVCTQVLGFSQTSGWYTRFEGVAGIDETTWQFLGHTGAGIEKWLNRDFSAWTDERPDAFGDYNYHDANNNRWVSECIQGRETPDRIILTISSVPTLSNILQDFPTYDTSNYPKDSVNKWVRDIKAAVAMLRIKYPTLRQIVLQALVGGPRHQVCLFDAGTTIVPVRASELHPAVDQAIAQVVADLRSQGITDVIEGYSPEVRSCADYADAKGHLSGPGYSAVAQGIGAYYATH